MCSALRIVFEAVPLQNPVKFLCRNNNIAFSLASPLHITKMSSLRINSYFITFQSITISAIVQQPMKKM